jgi:CheY-like chemotaxis protein
MDAATLARCREPFFTTKQEDKGTGLGLATVDDIVRLLGGRTDLSSAPGAGCTVFVSLPALQQAATGRSPSEYPLAPPVLHRHGRVLVAEDQPDVRAMLGEVLGGLGCEVILCEHGGQAWLRLDCVQSPCDLLITDIRMPVMDGLELAERVIERHPQLPILFISGHVDEPEELPHGPSYRLLPKPFSRDRLIQAVDELLRSVKH